MKNDECTIYMTTKRGTTQIYHKGKDGWTQTSSKGTVRPMTAEQLLSHILPVLAFGHVDIRVEPDKKVTKGKGKNWKSGKRKVG